jgi:hypothetical protein
MSRAAARAGIAAGQVGAIAVGAVLVESGMGTGATCYDTSTGMSMVTVSGPESPAWRYT